MTWESVLDRCLERPGLSLSINHLLPVSGNARLCDLYEYYELRGGYEAVYYRTRDFSLGTAEMLVACLAVTYCTTDRYEAHHKTESPTPLNACVGYMPRVYSPNTTKMDEGLFFFPSIFFHQS